MPGVLKGVKYEDPLVIYRGERVIDVIKRLSKGNVRANLDLAIDTYYTMYLPFPVVVDVDEIPFSGELNYTIIKSLVDSDMLKELKEYTIINSTTSTLLSASFLQHLYEELSFSSRGGSDSNELNENVDEGTLRRAVNNALKQVKEEGEVLKSIERLLSEGSEAGVGTTLDLEENAEDVLKLARSTDVRKLLDVMSLVPNVSRNIRRRTMKSSKGELRGYELGTDVERLVPVELVYPEIYLYMKLAEGRLLLYDKELPENLGPLYVLLDKSGSMEGEKIRWAKATAIALFIKARRERREYFIRFFDGSPHQLIRIPKRLKGVDIIKFVDYLARVKSGGGTDITKALMTACDDIKYGVTKGVTDVILVTDGEDRVSEHLIRKRFKSLEIRLLTVMIMGENRDLRNLSCKYLRAVKLSQKEILQITEG